MSYLKHKKGSLEEAVLEAVSKDVKEYVQADGTKRRVKEGDNRLKSNKLKIEDNTNDKSDDGEGLDKVQPDAVKKKFKDRKDKDIDNDGDVDDSDKFLHKRRKAISKAIKKEGNKFTMALKQARDNGDDEMVVSGKKYKVKEVEETIKLSVRSEESDAYFKVDTMRDALKKVWEKASPKKEEEEDEEEPKKKNGKTMTGQKQNDVAVNMPEKKIGKKMK
tara:strand:+ start:425 stop:1081 length:657 start_codon:yes stop_codon:yes gene_type:complete